MYLKNPAIALPAGLYNNGNRQDAVGRWHDGNLVRWADNALRAVGGWSRRKSVSYANIPAFIPNPNTSAPRGMFGWRDNASGRYTAIGTTDSLIVVDNSGAVHNITPTSYPAGLKDTGLRDGYGIGPYGVGAYGTPRDGANLLPLPVASWRFDAWGQDLLAAGPLGANTKLYQWAPGSPAVAAQVSGAPTGFSDFLVTDIRQVLVVGSGAGGNTISWSDVENNTVWTPTATNQAGSITLQTTGRLVAIVSVGGGYLVLEEAGAHKGTYTGALYGYGFRKIDGECTCLNAASVVVAGGVAYWPGRGQFYGYNGAGAVVPIQCDVWDYYERTRNVNEVSKTYGFVNSAFNEIWWLYQSEDSETTDCNRYLSYNYMTKAWSYGEIRRCVGIDAVVTSQPQMVSRYGEIFNHEQRTVVIPDTWASPYAITGPIEYRNQIAHVNYFMPANSDPIGYDITFYARDSGNSPPRTNGPYQVRSPATPVKVRGRDISIMFNGNGLVASWQLSPFGLDVTLDGDR